MIELLAMSGTVNITRGKLTSQSLILQGDMTKFGSANSEFCAVDINNDTFSHTDTDPNAVRMA